MIGTDVIDGFQENDSPCSVVLMNMFADNILKFDLLMKGSQLLFVCAEFFLAVDAVKVPVGLLRETLRIFPVYIFPAYHKS